MISRIVPRRGFTLVEMLVVVSIIVVLVGFLIPALANVRKSALQTKSVSRMKQIGQWISLYSTDNREYIVPSHFDYTGDQYTFKGSVRAPVDPASGAPVDPTLGQRHEGTWADILWSVNDLGGFDVNSANPPLLYDYSNDSPDHFLYTQVEEFDNPLRAAAPNSRDTGQTTDPSDATPYGPGARDINDPGYFAANNFFDAAPDPSDPDDLGTWWVTGQIRRPDRSMYLVDSVAGETIGEGGLLKDDDGSFVEVMDTLRTGQPGEDGRLINWLCEVDFRYNGNCLMLFLDGHVEPYSAWGIYDNLEESLQVRILELNKSD